MENRPQASAMATPFSDPQERRDAAPVACQTRAEPPVMETRAAQPAVATDGQLVEAGYGHGV